MAERERLVFEFPQHEQLIREMTRWVVALRLKSELRLYFIEAG
jgi:hypothetical protein